MSLDAGARECHVAWTSTAHKQENRRRDSCAGVSGGGADSHGGVGGHSHVLKTVKHTDELCRAFDGCTLAILAALSRIELY